MITFSEFLTEAKEMLDISILSADKFLTSAKRIHDFLFTPCEIEAKTDGVKLTVVKVADDGRLSDYIFAYKGNVLYNSEFNYQPKLNPRLSVPHSLNWCLIILANLAKRTSRLELNFRLST